MTISDLIYDHFAGIKNGLKKGAYNPLTMVSLKNIALDSLRFQTQNTDRNIGQDALLPFLNASIKTTVKEDGIFDVSFVARPLGKIKKDLWQILTSGMFSDNLIEAKMQKISHYKDEKDAGFKIYSAFVNENDYWKTKIETNKTYEKYVNVIISSGEATLKGGKLNIVADDIERGKTFTVSGPAIVLATNLYHLHKMAKQINIDESFVEPVVYLSALLLMPALTTKEDIKSKNDFTFELSRKLLPYLYESISKEIENNTAYHIVDFAVNLANSRIEKLNHDIFNYNKGKDDKERLEEYPRVDSLYYDMKIDQLTKQKIVKFQDLPIRWSKNGSNFKWEFVSKEGKVGYMFVDDDKKLEEGSASLAFKGLASNDEEQILASFEFFDSQIVGEENHDKVVDTFEETAEILYANLILLSYINKIGRISEENRKNMEQIFTIPLIKCLNNMGKDSIKIAEQKAYDSVRKLFVDAKKGDEFDDNFKYFNHRYNRKKLSENFIKDFSKIAIDELRKAQNKKNTKKGNEKIEEVALSKLLPELSLSYKNGIINALYEGVLPDDFESKNADRKDYYKSVYEAIKNGHDIVNGDKPIEIYLNLLLNVGKNLNEIQKLGDNNPNAVLDDQIVKTVVKSKQDIKKETKDTIKSVLDR